MVAGKRQCIEKMRQAKAEREAEAKVAAYHNERKGRKAGMGNAPSCPC
jgi:hypothetical protein